MNDKKNGKPRGTVSTREKSKGGKRSLEKEKCLKCKFVRCVDLFRSGDGIDGGELSVLGEELRKPAKVLPCLMATPLQACCRLWSGANETLGDRGWTPLLQLVWQCMYDLKASIFLAITAHYRSAVQLLRPVIENLLTGLYFEDKLTRCDTDEQIELIQHDFERWQDGNYAIPEEESRLVFGANCQVKKLFDFGFLAGWLHMRGVMDGKTKSRFERLQSTLNKHLHPYFPYTDVGGERCSVCPGTVAYDEERYQKWLEAFQNVADAVITAVDTFYPDAKETEKGKEAFSLLQTLDRVGQEFSEPTIVCPYLRSSARSIGEPDA